MELFFRKIAQPVLKIVDHLAGLLGWHNQGLPNVLITEMRKARVLCVYYATLAQRN